MKDSRFTTVADGIDDLLNLVDIDEVDDIETLLMFLFDRPVRVDETWDDEGVAVSLDVIVPGNDGNIGSVYEFPFSVVALVRSCAETVADLGPYTHDGASPSTEAQDILGMTHAELIAALQQALGKVRIFNLMDSDE